MPVAWEGSFPIQDGRAAGVPCASTVLLLSTQSFADPVLRVSPRFPRSFNVMPSRFAGLKVMRCSVGATRWGRIHCGTAICTNVKTTSVTAMAGSVRRRIVPTVTPRTTAKIVYDTGTMPRIANETGVIRAGKLPRVLLSTPSSGRAHQLVARVSTPTASAAPAVTMPSLVASQRVRVIDWFHTRRWVPVSSSRATSGAPQKTPMIAGTTASTTMPV